MIAHDTDGATEPPRYRTDGGMPTVDVRLPALDRFFDNRDPAPFRQRDLDPDLVELLMDAAEDLLAHDRFKIVFWLEGPGPPDQIETAFAAHFAYERDRRARARRRQVRVGLVALSIAVVAIIVLVGLGALIQRVVGGTVGAGLREGLVVSGWVLMWRPIEVLIYDRIPWRREQRVLVRLLEAPREVRPIQPGQPLSEVPRAIEAGAGAPPVIHGPP